MRTMTPEERYERMEGLMEFLATQQAKLSASLESMRENSAGRASEIAAHTTQIEAHSAQIEAHSTQIGKLADVVASLARIFEEQGRRTDERLNALINTVERHISNGRHHRN